MKCDLNDMLYFVNAVDHQGYTAAAKALGVSKSLLSRRIASLEESLGVRLLQRSTRRFNVTDLGLKFAEQCRLAVQQAQIAEDLVSNALAYPSGKLKIAAPVMMTEEFMAPVVCRFIQKYPDVEIELLAMNRDVDLTTEGIDIAIRPEPLPLRDSSLHVKPLCIEHQILVCSPDYIARFGMPNDVSELAQHATIIKKSDDNNRQWRLINVHKEKVTLNVTPRLITNNMRAVVYAAINGVGITCLPRFICLDHIDSGALVHVLPEWTNEPHSIHALYESKRGQTLLFKTFLDYLSQSLNEVRRINKT